MVRSVMKTCFAYAYHGATRVRKLVPRRSMCGAELPFIVCYHRVVDDFEMSARYTIPSMLISAAMLERHIEWLARRYSIVPLDEIGSYLESPRRLARPPAAITFDDGYSDVYYNALPLLLRKGVPAAVFPVTALINTACPQLFDRLYLSLSDLQVRGAPVSWTVNVISRSMEIDTRILDRLKPSCDEPFRVMSALLRAVPRSHVEKIVAALENGAGYSADVVQEMKPMTWDMLSTIVRQGFTLGSHTISHALLTSETAETIRMEVRESKHALENRLHIPIRHFAYPDGRFNDVVVEATEAAGYRYGYGICRARHARFPLLTIPRKVLWERSCVNALGNFSAAMMNCQANWAFGQRECSRHNHRSIRQMEHHANAF
jgi:peptidoglycan/xylan/chitin deacetylase (PgdA/CDA1 family)